MNLKETEHLNFYSDVRSLSELFMDSRQGVHKNDGTDTTESDTDISLREEVGFGLVRGVDGRGVV